MFDYHSYQLSSDWSQWSQWSQWFHIQYTYLYYTACYRPMRASLARAASARPVLGVSLSSKSNEVSMLSSMKLWSMDMELWSMELSSLEAPRLFRFFRFSSFFRRLRYSSYSALSSNLSSILEGARRSCWGWEETWKQKHVSAVGGMKFEKMVQFCWTPLHKLQVASCLHVVGIELSGSVSVGCEQSTRGQPNCAYHEWWTAVFGVQKAFKGKYCVSVHYRYQYTSHFN